MTTVTQTARRLPAPLFVGFAIASIGGPLALLSLFVPQAAADVFPSIGLVTVLAVVAFVAPLAIWLGYSERIASGGGLTAFVEAAAGTRVARAQAAIWTVAYALYLPYTVTFVVYTLLPAVVPGVKPYRALLELVLPLALAAFVLAPVVWVLGVLLAVAIVQLGLMLVLGGLEYANAGASLASFRAHSGAVDTAKAAGAIGVLFVCSSLPLYLGGEVSGGARTVRRGLTLAFVLVSAYVVATVFPLAQVPEALRTAPIPGMAIAQAYSGHALAVTVGLATAASVTALIVAEYLAIGRLAHAVLGAPVRKVLALVAIPFVASDAISLVDPNRFYDNLLKPSLVALFLSQIVVFAFYPRWRRRERGRVRALDLGLTGVAIALMGYGLYNVFGSAAT